MIESRAARNIGRKEEGRGAGVNDAPFSYFTLSADRPAVFPAAGGAPAAGVAAEADLLPAALPFRHRLNAHLSRANRAGLSKEGE